MSKVRIKVITLWHRPPRIDLARVKNQKSQIFEIVGQIESHAIRSNADGASWDFSDEKLRRHVSIDSSVDFVLALTNVPLSHNWYSRRIGDNRVVLTLHEIKDYLKDENIPLENVVMRMIYANALSFKRQGKIPEYSETDRHTHDETRGCLYDMNGIKTNIVESCVSPIICEECQEKLRADRVSNETISIAQKEIRKIKKSIYYKGVDFIKQKPIAALLISSIYAVFIGAIGSLVASFLWERYGL